MFKPDKKTVLLLLLLGGIIAGSAYAVHISGLFDLFVNRSHLVRFFREHHTYGALIFIGLQALQVIAAPIPGELTGFVGGRIFGLVWGIVYSSIGLIVGSWIAFMLARLLGRPLVERMVSVNTIQRYDYVMKHKGLWLAFLMFLIPGFPKDFLCYLLGLGHMRQRDFLLISAVGRIPGTVLLTMGGTFFRDERYVALFTVVGVSIIFILFFMMYHERIEQILRRMAGALRKDSQDKSTPPE